MNLAYKKMAMHLLLHGGSATQFSKATGKCRRTIFLWRRKGLENSESNFREIVRAADVIANS